MAEDVDATPPGRSLAVFDVDGVVADVRHRLHHLERGRAWHRFFDAAADDPVLDEGARLVADLGRRLDVVWLTGRPEWLRDVTEHWMAEHGLPHDELHMRPHGDHRPAPVYKLSVLRELAGRGTDGPGRGARAGRTVEAFVDDDDEVVRVAIQAGFPAVLADWVPRGRTLRRAQDRDGRT